MNVLKNLCITRTVYMHQIVVCTLYMYVTGYIYMYIILL